MLDTLETLIAFATVMLGASLLITILTQMVSAVLGSRGTNLRWGLVQLLKAVQPDMDDRAVRTTVEHVLTHPLISDSTMCRLRRRFPILSRWGMASTIRVEELVEILGRLSTSARATPEAKGAAVAAAATGGLVGPATVSIGTQADPALDEIAPHLGDIARWFNSAMDRTAQRFAMYMRIWTVVFAVALAFALQLDSFDLLKRISTDSKLRTGLAASYATMSETAAKVIPTDQNKATVEELQREAGSVRAELEAAGFDVIPKDYREWRIKEHFWGILFSIAMLSLGAPFWFNALKSLCNLRPVLANKEASERTTSPAGA